MTFFLVRILTLNKTWTWCADAQDVSCCSLQVKAGCQLTWKYLEAAKTEAGENRKQVHVCSPVLTCRLSRICSVEVPALGTWASMARSSLSHSYYYCRCRQPADATDGCESKTTWWRLPHLGHLFPDGRKINTVSQIDNSTEKITYTWKQDSVISISFCSVSCYCCCVVIVKLLFSIEHNFDFVFILWQKYKS